MKTTSQLWRGFGQRLLTLLCGLGLVVNASAHDPGLSTAAGRLRADSLEITLALSIKDAVHLAPLDANGDGSVTKDEFDSSRTNFISTVADKFLVEADGTFTRPTTTLAWYELSADAYCMMVFPLQTVSNLTIQSKLLEELPLGHRQFLTLEFENGSKQLNHLLSRNDNSFSVETGKIVSSEAKASPTTQSFTGFLALGVEHILTGYDHLLFLFALLVVTSRFMSALQIITCFTIAHSITLAVATLNVVHIPSRIVEPLIAASIVYVGIENLFRGDDPKGRWLLTFAFGLIHGFGFASVLRELGVGANGSGIVMPLLSFNLGVELGQIMVAAIALPVIWKLRTHPVFVQRWAPACSVLVAILGGYWFVARVWMG